MLLALALAVAASAAVSSESVWLSVDDPANEAAAYDVTRCSGCGQVRESSRLSTATAALCWTLAWCSVRAALSEQYEPTGADRRYRSRLVTIDLSVAFVATVLAIRETARSVRGR